MDETEAEEISVMEGEATQSQVTRERSLFVQSLSKVYGLFIIAMGVVIAWAHIISGRQVSYMIPMIYFTIIYGVSLAYLIYIHIFLTRNLSHYQHPNSRPIYSVSVQVHPEESKSIPDDRLPDAKTDGRANNNEESSPSYKNVSIGGGAVAGAALFRTGNDDYPNFYLRVGAIVFGAGTMVYHGLELGKIGGDTLTCGADLDIASLLASGLHFIFVFYQVFFIFKHSKIAINSQKDLARFGVMHLMAANICACVMAVMEETLRCSTGTWLYPVRQNESVENTAGPTPDVSIHDRCIKTASMSVILYRSSPYLYPCVIQYSIIGIVAMYNIYRNIARYSEDGRKRPNTTESEPEVNADDTIEIESGYSCHKSYHGLFLGIIILVATVISFIIFSVFTARMDQKSAAGKIYVITELAVLLMTFCATTAAMFQIRVLPFDADRLPTHKLDRFLLMLGICGVYSLDGFRALLSLHNDFSWISVVSLIRPFISSVQATLQVMLIFDGIKRYTHTPSLLLRKPGREAIIFILVTNLSLWAMYTFEAKTTYGEQDVYLFFNRDVWFLVLNVTSPIAVFFRFHSTTCLYEIWKKAFRLEKSPESCVKLNTIA